MLNIQAFKSQNINHIILYVLIFVIPLFPFLAPLFIAILFFLTCYQCIKSKKNEINTSHFLLIVFYLLSVIAFMFSDNKVAALFDLEVKLSFIVIPLIFLLSKQLKNLDFEKVLQVFIIGNLFAFVCCVSYASYQFLILHEGFNVFNYTSFSIFRHPSYFGMYLTFSLLAIHYLIKNYSFTKLELIAYLITYFFFVIAIALLSAKVSIILTVFILFYFLFDALIKKIRLPFLLLGILLSFSIFYLLYKKTPLLSIRIQESMSNALINPDSINPQSGDISTTLMRKFIWQHAVKLIAKQPLGYGTGQADTVLQNSYKQQGLYLANTHQLNAHNQYFQTALELGLFGLFLLLLIFLVPVFLKVCHPLYIPFCIIIALNFLTESMLETQAGVIFFVIFYCVLTLKSIDKKT